MSALPLVCSPTMASLPGRVVRPLLQGRPTERPAFGSRLRLVRPGMVPPAEAPLIHLPVDPEAGQRLASQLTPRQRDVLEHLLQGAPTKEICRALGMSEGTAKAHIAELLKTFNVESRAMAIVEALRLGLIALQPKQVFQ